eukprot:188165-Chlamydomonas_euryale.AAC.1
MAHTYSHDACKSLRRAGGQSSNWSSPLALRSCIRGGCYTRQWSSSTLQSALDTSGRLEH